MQNSSSENLSLIYEFNEKSPLFARVAEEHLNSGNTNEALEILEKGLTDYPLYASAQIVYAKTLAKMGKTEQAEAALKIAGKLLDNSQTVDFYLNELKEFKIKDTGISSNNSEDIPENTPDGIKVVEKIEDAQKGENLDDKLDDLVEKLSTYKAPPAIREDFSNSQSSLVDVPDETTNDYEDNELASETLGMILESQGKFNEAKSIYRKLIKMEPDKAQVFELKIQEIDEQLTKKANE